MLGGHGRVAASEEAQGLLDAPRVRDRLIRNRTQLHPRPCSRVWCQAEVALIGVSATLGQGAELWVNPGINQGFGLADTHGAAGFSSAEAHNLGAEYLYARVDRYFIRQTIDLGRATQKVEVDTNQFADSTTENRQVLTIGMFAVVDIFDTNKYVNRPKPIS